MDLDSVIAEHVANCWQRKPAKARKRMSPATARFWHILVDHRSDGGAWLECRCYRPRFLEYREFPAWLNLHRGLRSDSR